MRVLLALLLCLLPFSGPAVAEDQEEKTPPKPAAPAMSEKQRETALSEAIQRHKDLMVLFRAGKYREAVASGRKALDLFERALGPEHLDVARVSHNLGALLGHLGSQDEAGPLLERALKIREKRLGPEHPDVGATLSALAARLQELGELDQAKLLLERALAIQEKAQGPEHPAVADGLNDLAALLQAQGEYGGARPLHERALKIREQAFGPEHPTVANSLNNLAALLKSTGALREAKPLFARALAIFEKALGPNHAEVANSLNNLATVHHALGAYEQAKPLYARALKIREQTLGPTHPAVATSLANLASLLRDLGDHVEAESLLRRALKIQEQALGPTHPALANSLTQLGSLLETNGRYDEARPLLERALTIQEQALGPTHPEVATGLNNLASLFVALGAYDKARPLYERALNIWEKALGPNHLFVATGLGNLASLLSNLGAYDEARPLYERALKISEQALGHDHPRVALELNSLGGLLSTLGAYEEAKPLLERSLMIVEKTLGPAHLRTAHSLHSLGSVLQALGATDKAKALFRRALEIAERSLGPEHPHVAAILNSLGLLLKHAGALDEAKPLFERALRIAKQTVGPDHPDVASPMNNLASLLKDRGAYDKALPLFERSLEIQEKALGPEHPGVANALNNLAEVLQDMKQHKRARPLLKRCLEITEANTRRNLLGQQGNERAAAAHDGRIYLNNWLGLERHLGETGYAEVLRHKGLAARAEAAERRLARRGDTRTAARLESLREAERRFSRLTNSRPARGSDRTLWSARLKTWREAFAKASEERERLALAIQRDFAPLRQGMERLDLDLADIQKRLAPDRVLVDTLLTGGEYRAFLVRHEGAPEVIVLGEATYLEFTAAKFANMAADPDATEADRQESGLALHDLVWAPIEKRLAPEVHTVVLSPDAVLATIPFASLPSRKTGERGPARLLMDDYSWISVAMAQDLVPWKGDEHSAKGALLVGKVDYENGAEMGDIRSLKDVGPTVGRPTAQVAARRAPRGKTFAPLEGTSLEVSSIRGRLGSDAVLLSGPSCTEAALRALAPGKRVLHLATHGFVRTDLLAGLKRRASDRTWLGAGKERRLARGYDPMNLAGLALAGANPRKGGGEDDGILTALEVSYLDLDGVELVVLSACETALGRSASGQGVLGLVRGFQMSGAKQVVGSLWHVDDKSTQALMVKFYELWLPRNGKAGLGAAVALRKAQAFIRNHPDHPEWKHPHYWAAWVLWGTGR